jgi:hypothetical protein
LLPRQDLIPVPDFANEEPVAEEVGEGPPSERDAPTSLARRVVRSRLGADVFGSEVTDKLVDAGDLEISAKDQPDPFGLSLDDDKCASLRS